MTTQSITLTNDQEAALDAFREFFFNPDESIFVLSGYSGCGKSTLVRTILEQLPSWQATANLIHIDFKDYQIELTATTNKAAEQLTQITGQPARTIHSFLGLRVQMNYKTNTSTLLAKEIVVHNGLLIFIDEASFIDHSLLNHIFHHTKNCKLVFIGDPAQLTPVKSTNATVFNRHYKGAALTQVVRQGDGNPIVDLSSKFRDTVNTGEFFQFTPDGHHVKYLDSSDFNAAINKEFTRANWRYTDSKILGWTNKCVIDYNQMVRNQVTGDPDFQVGDYAICNSYTVIGRVPIKTDQMVEITGIGEQTDLFGVPGKYFNLDGMLTPVFQPSSLQAKNARVKQARKEDDMNTVSTIESTWIDLRAAYACTINKSQGSTFDQVFIDLSDVSRCNSGDQIARMMYVAVSRARNHVFLTGDLA